MNDPRIQETVIASERVALKALEEEADEMALPERRLWTPNDELEFIKAWTMPPKESLGRSVLRIELAERLQALDRYIKLLPLRSFPLWESQEVDELILKARALLQKGRENLAGLEPAGSSYRESRHARDHSEEKR